MKNNIRVKRAEKRFSQDDLALEANTSRQTIHQVETEKTEPRLGLAMRIAKALGAKVEEIFEEE